MGVINEAPLVSQDQLADVADDRARACWGRDHRVELTVATGLLCFALALRLPAFIDPTAHVDDQFYRLVGAELVRGAVLYADIWDRKPPGIFILAAAISAVSTATWFYYMVATVFAAGTAQVIALICRHWTGRQGSIFAAIVYLVALQTVAGGVGQSSVFYNLFTALGALSILRRRYYWAMLTLGVSLSFKQTAAFECIALGLYTAHKIGWRHIPSLVLCGLTPLIIVCIPVLGHLSEAWQAMFLSSLDRDLPNDATILGRSLDLFRRLIPLSATAFLGLYFSRHHFVAIWLAAALLGVIAVPQLYLHYAIPLLNPLCVASASFLNRRLEGPVSFVGIVGFALMFFTPFDFAKHKARSEQFYEIANLIKRQPGDDLLVYEGPVELYTATDRRYLSPLVFPTHLNFAAEQDVSHLTTTDEMRRILSQRPSIVATTAEPLNDPPNRETREMLSAYLSKCVRLSDGLEVWRCQQSD